MGDCFRMNPTSCQGVDGSWVLLMVNQSSFLGSHPQSLESILLLTSRSSQKGLLQPKLWVTLGNMKGGRGVKGQEWTEEISGLGGGLGGECEMES